ncbi:hypothetical protein VNI00_011609 [Paramarasmius palmivorus]|uniref:F-box domain-containing protein n=1 Tax=Paramarasmius palmivorus TaxID=297713 RepID=A0AAW0CBS1_9AGAR
MKEQAQLQLLPDDIIFKILPFLSPLDILRLRQVARRLHKLTLERTVWTTTYRTSSLFLPPISPSQTVHDLERALIRASQLDANWESANLKIELYHGRYLLLRSRSSFCLYDLDKPGDWDTPIYESVEAGYTYVFSGLGPSRSDTSANEEVYIPILRRQRTMDQDLLTIWKLCPDKPCPLVVVSEFPTSPSTSIWLANSILICDWEKTTGTHPLPMVYDIKTQRRYRFPAPRDPEGENIWKSQSYHTEYIPTVDHVFAMHISLQETVIQVFSYPPSDAVDPDILIQTHFGVCPKGFTEPALVASNANDGGDVTLTLCLTAIFHRAGLHLFRLHLHQDGTLSFDIPPSGGISSAYSLIVTANRLGRARGVSLTSNSSVTLLLHNMEFTFGDDPRTELRENSTIIPELTYGNDYTYDGFRGRLCVPSDSSVEIYDFV